MIHHTHHRADTAGRCLITFFNDAGQRSAGGHLYGGNRIAASRLFPFGTRVLITYHRRQRLYVVDDRGGKVRGHHFDIPERAHDAQFGPEGLVFATFRVVRWGKKL